MISFSSQTCHCGILRTTSGLAVRHDPGNQCVQMGFSTQEQLMLLLLLLLLMLLAP